MVKRVIIVHGWEGSPNEPIHQWLKKELVNRGIKVISPFMPDTMHPKINDWVNHLSKEVDQADPNTFFFGHSIGCQTIMRYLETLNEDQKVGGAVFLSGWFNLDNMESKNEKEIAKPWIKNPINFNRIKKVCNKIEVIISDDEPYGYVNENAERFKKELNANITIEHGKGHFTANEGITQIPEALERIMKLVNSK
ncbi:MAG: alpha/beta hydrolase [Nanoarchaeota archaeon]